MGDSNGSGTQNADADAALSPPALWVASTLRLGAPESCPAADVCTANLRGGGLLWNMGAGRGLPCFLVVQVVQYQLPTGILRRRGMQQLVCVAAPQFMVSHNSK